MTKTYASLIYLAIRYDKNEGWTTWLDNFKRKPPEISKETTDLFSSPTFSAISPKAMNGENFKNLFDRFNITDHREELEKFMKSWNGVGDATEAYRQHLIKADKTTNSFGKSALNVFKSLGAGLLSMGVNMLAGMAIDFIITSINKAAEEKEKAAEKAREVMEKEIETAKQTAEESRNIADSWADLSSQIQKTEGNMESITEAFLKQAIALGANADEIERLIGDYDKMNKFAAQQAYDSAKTASRDADKEQFGDGAISVTFFLQLKKMCVTINLGD